MLVGSTCLITISSGVLPLSGHLMWLLSVPLISSSLLWVGSQVGGVGDAQRYRPSHVVGLQCTHRDRVPVGRGDGPLYRQAVLVDLHFEVGGRGIEQGRQPLLPQGCGHLEAAREGARSRAFVGVVIDRRGTHCLIFERQHRVGVGRVVELHVVPRVRVVPVGDGVFDRDLTRVVHPAADRVIGVPFDGGQVDQPRSGGSVECVIDPEDVALGIARRITKRHCPTGSRTGSAVRRVRACSWPGPSAPRRMRRPPVRRLPRRPLRAT